MIFLSHHKWILLHPVDRTISADTVPYHFKEIQVARH